MQKFFQKMDTDNDGKLSGTEIVGALCNACKNKVSDRLENFKDELEKSTEAVRLDKFKEIAHRMSIATGQRARWATSLNLSGRLARLFKVGEPFDEMSGVKQMGEADIETLLDEFVCEVRRVVRKEVKNIKAESLAFVHSQQNVLNSKFVVGKFGDTEMFLDGLESQLGSCASERRM